MKTLFVTEKWFGGAPSLSFTNNFHNLFNTFSSALGMGFTWDTIHIDEAHYTYKRHVDEIVPEYCSRNGIKIVFYCLLGTDYRNPSASTFQAVKGMNILQCFMWPDTAPWALDKIKELKGLADLHVSWDNTSIPTEYSDNHLCMWVPQDQFLFFPDEQRIDVNFTGSKHQKDRVEYLTFLGQKLSNISIRGGQNEERLTPQVYAALIRKSKINLNFPLHPFGFEQVKGRVFEVLASKSLLLEKANNVTNKLLIPSVDYVEFEGLQDASDKIEYLLNNEDERKKIAESGYKKYRESYSSDIFWKTIINKLLNRKVYEIKNNFNK